MSSLYDSAKGKRIYLYRNGDPTFFGKPLIVNKRQIRNVSVLLSVATSHLRMGEQVREIRTPDQGRFVVETLDDLREDQAYVAVGIGRFKRMQYTSLQDEHDRKLEILKKRRERVLQMPQKKVTLSPVIVPNVGATKEVVIILVYTNGDEYSPAKKIVLRPRNLRNWNLILNEIDDVLKAPFGPVTRLYTLEGKPVLDQRELVSGETYVAGGRSGGFKNVPYGNQKKFIVQYNVRQQPYDSLFLTEHAATLQGESVTVGVSPREPPSRLDKDLSNNARSRSQRLKYADGTEVFPFRAKRHRRKKKKKRESVYRPSKEREEVTGAEEVIDEYQERSFTDIIEEDEELSNRDRDGLALQYVATPPPNPRPSNSTGNRRRAARGRKSGSPPVSTRRESGVGPSLPGQSFEEDSEDRGRFDDSIGDVPDSMIDRRNEEEESWREELEEETDARKSESYEAYYEERRKEEAAKKIQKAYRRHHVPNQQTKPMVKEEQVQQNEEQEQEVQNEGQTREQEVDDYEEQETEQDNRSFVNDDELNQPNHKQELPVKSHNGSPQSEKIKERSSNPPESQSLPLPPSSQPSSPQKQPNGQVNRTPANKQTRRV